MPTKHPRIAVTNDPILAGALAAVAPYFSGQKPASVVRALAIKGAEVVARERREQDEAIERLITASTHRSDSLDWGLLEHVGERVWSE